MADIKGISPSICMYKILLDDCSNNSVEHQRRFNHIMKEVVKKKIIKWLDAGMCVYGLQEAQQNYKERPFPISINRSDAGQTC